MPFQPAKSPIAGEGKTPVLHLAVETARRPAGAAAAVPAVCPFSQGVRPGERCGGAGSNQREKQEKKAEI